jgi:hypothetical protein
MLNDLTKIDYGLWLEHYANGYKTWISLDDLTKAIAEAVAERLVPQYEIVPLETEIVPLGPPYDPTGYVTATVDEQ